MLTSRLAVYIQRTDLWWCSESAGAAFIGIVHEFLQVLKELQEQSQAELIGVVTLITLSSTPVTQLLLCVQTMGRQTADHTYSSTGIKC